MDKNQDLPRAIGSDAIGIGGDGLGDGRKMLFEIVG